MKPAIYRDVFMVYKDESVSLIEATKFEIAYFKRYLMSKDLKYAIVKINKKKLSAKNKKTIMSFETFIASLGLRFRVGKLVKEKNQRHNRLWLIILILIQLIVIILLGIYVK